MRIVAGVLCLVLLVACGACHETEQERSGDNAVAKSGEASADRSQTAVPKGPVTGTVRHIDVEGGFYGIETDDGLKLDPVNLPADFQQDGVRVRVTVEPLKDRISFHMWGKLVRIVAIERL
ncbi:MAG: hypothetical protein ABFE01_28135 [Phycisphaerales bacterium]